jgi:hypothetical protein
VASGVVTEAVRLALTWGVVTTTYDERGGHIARFYHDACGGEVIYQGAIDPTTGVSRYHCRCAGCGAALLTDAAYPMVKAL